mmetsp:Transcript_20833/g.35315  ORF Transcript_20833/g.35315 Transcript_20833/m.35315 type:complete len:114 (-) Transcript_20833:68-409(-)
MCYHWLVLVVSLHRRRIRWDVTGLMSAVVLLQFVTALIVLKTWLRMGRFVFYYADINYSLLAYLAFNDVNTKHKFVKTEKRPRCVTFSFLPSLKRRKNDDGSARWLEDDDSSL